MRFRVVFPVMIIISLVANSGWLLAIPPQRVLDQAEKIRNQAEQIRSEVVDEINANPSNYKLIYFDDSGEKVEYLIDSSVKSCTDPKCGCNWFHRDLDKSDVQSAYDYPRMLRRSFEILKKNQPTVLNEDDDRLVGITIIEQLRVIDDGQSFDAVRAQLLDLQKRGYAHIDAAVGRYAKDKKGKTAQIIPGFLKKKDYAHITVKTKESGAKIYWVSASEASFDDARKNLAMYKALDGGRKSKGNPAAFDHSFNPKSTSGHFFALWEGNKVEHSGPKALVLKETKKSRAGASAKDINIISVGP